jgi:penicillin-binding protein 1C
VKSRFLSFCLRISALGVLALVAAWGGFRWLRSSAGEPSELLDDPWFEGARVVDRNGKDLREIPSEKGMRGRETTLEEMGPRIVLATLVAEDHDFYAHDGVDGEALLRAAGTNLVHRKLVSGGSTITEQLVKLLENEGSARPRTLAAKLVEMARAQNLEERTDKHAILEAYLNRLPYGHSLVGPESAAQGYFGVAAKDLSWAQAALLAVVPRAPSALDPVLHGQKVVVRQRLVLEALRERGFLSVSDLARAEAESVAPTRPSHGLFAPYLVDALKKDGRLAAHGTTRTTIDLTLERDVEGLVRTHLASVASYGATQAAAIVVDNATGEVLAYVGGADYDEPRSGKVDMARAHRQPGSTLKPFVYSLAFEHGRTESEMIADVPTSFPSDTGTYSPSNFDGTFEGPISLREALAGSLNIPAIRLAAELPRGALLDRLHALGFELPEDAAHYGLSLVLGSGEVSLRELAGAYATLARGGESVPLRETFETAPPSAEVATRARVIDPAAAALVADALSDSLARVRGLHGRGPFDIGFPVAVKTGTSSGYRDTWTAGFTHARTVAIWVGNSDGSPMRGLAGASGAGPLFADVMRRTMRDVPARAPLWDPSLLVEVEVCPLSGHLAGAACPDHVVRRFAKGTATAAHCDLHVHASKRTPSVAPDPRTGSPAGEAPYRCDETGTSTLVLLPSSFDDWLATQPSGAPGHDVYGLPWFSRSRVPGCSEAGQSSRIVFDAPAEGSVLVLSRFRGDAESIELRASVSGPATGPIELTVDGRVVGEVAAPPFRIRIPAEAGDHVAIARPKDPRAEVQIGTVHFSVR